MLEKTAVVTGGAGFIGSHICDRLISEGFKVACVDNLITGRIENIRHLLKDNNFKFIKHNVCEYIDIKGKVGYILHFASPASPEDYLRFPIQTLKVGSLGTHNALGLAKVKKARFMLASTSEVYGNPLEHPQREDYYGNVNCIGPRGAYDEAKRFAEALTMAYHRVHKIDTKIIRIFNTYGPRMRIKDGRVVPNFIYQVLNGKAMTVYGSGKQTRSFCYIDDLVDGIFKMMLAKVSGPINLGNPDEFTVLELARLIQGLADSKSRIVFKPLPEDDPLRRKPDISKAKKILGWQPRVSLASGLKDTIEWFQKQVF